MDNEKCILLIDLYKEHHLLWDPKHKQYHNNTLREDAWKEISLILGIAVDKLKTKMKSLMGTYRREKSRQKQSQITGSEMAPAYKVTYFDITALGEPIRFLLSYGGIEFQDNRIQMDNWPALKSTVPFGQIPTLEHNGKVAHQSVAICRYLAKQVKLVGKDDWEDLEIDATVDTINDLRLKIAVYHYEQDEKIKETKGVPVFKEIIPFYLEKLDAQAKKNNGYLVGSRLTWADVFFVAYEDYLNSMAKRDIFANSPNLQIVKENVLKLPNIKRWIERRPKGCY